MDGLQAGRITRRLLVQRHLHAHHAFHQTAAADADAVLSSHVDPLECVRRAYDAAAAACGVFFDATPRLLVAGPPPRPLRYVQSHLDVMLTELLKNAIFATCAHADQRGHGATDLPPVRVSIHAVAGGEDAGEVTFSIADRVRAAWRKTRGKPS